MTTTNLNVPLLDWFQQVCVWEWTVVQPDNTPKDFEDFMLNELWTRVQYLEEVKTWPTIKEWKKVSWTGGRNDLLFAVHNDDIQTFALKRLNFWMRWIEDV